MGVFGTGLYAGDFALDVRSTVAAVLRLPLDPDRLVDIVHGTEPSVADNSSNEDHTTFWLVIADQFAKRGVAPWVDYRSVCRVARFGKSRYYTECPSEQKNERVLQNFPVEIYLSDVESTLRVAVSRMRAQPTWRSPLPNLKKASPDLPASPEKSRRGHRGHAAQKL